MIMKISHFKSVICAISVSVCFSQAYSGEKVFDCIFKDDVSNWKNYTNKETYSVAEDGSLKIASQGKLGGVVREVKVQPGNMNKVFVEVKGSGKFQAAINGSGGFAYSPETKLTDEWQKIEMSYFEKNGAVKFYLLSLSDTPETFYVKNVVFEKGETAELQDSEIPCLRIEAEKYPGNGLVKQDPKASGGAYVSGKKWYRIVNIPMPLTSKPIYVNVKVSADITGKCSVRACSGSQVLKEVPLTESGKWNWIQLGPFDARAVGKTLTISQVSAPDTELKVDKLVLTTNKSLETAEMEKE
jgi:hypothetical protein